MIEILIYVALAIAACVLALLAYAARQPDTFWVARTANINAPAERIFPLINELRTMNTWNPFALNDPRMNGSYSGPASGVGAQFAFEGKRSGAGRIEITEATSPSKVAMHLAMWRPMKADNAIEFSLDPTGASTDVTWAMTGKTPLSGKVLHLFMDVDKMCGGAFEEGLAKLKVIAEGRD